MNYVIIRSLQSDELPILELVYNIHLHALDSHCRHSKSSCTRPLTVIVLLQASRTWQLAKRSNSEGIRRRQMCTLRSNIHTR